MKMYTRPISVVLSAEMFQQIKAITDRDGIAISDYVRQAVRKTLTMDEQNQYR